VDLKKIAAYLAPFTLVIIAILFIYNIFSHGMVTHPGKAQYEAQCAQCHGDNGEGIKTLIPPLNHSDFALKNIDSIPCWLKFGLNRPIMVHDTLYDQPMYPGDYDEVQISNLVNFMNDEFFNSDRKVDPAWVRERLKNCQ
jgi:mono/diheme cytochrome c family protein